MSTIVLRPLEPFQHIPLKDGNHLWFSQEPLTGQEIEQPIAFSPADVEWKAPAHFHPHTDEYQRCLVGQIHLTMDGVERILRPEDGEVKISRGVVHSLWSPRREYAEFQERQEPDPVKKRDFLIRLFAITESPSGFLLLKVLTHFYEDGDAFPAESSKWLGKVMVYVVGGFFGSFLGLGKFEEKD